MKKLHAIFFLFLIICTTACENTEQEINSLNKKQVGVEVASTIKAIYTTAGKTKAILASPLMYRVQDTVNFYEFPKTLAVDFYNEQGVVNSKLNANYAKYTDATSVVFLKDSIRIIGLDKGDTLYCHELYWDRNRTGTEFYTDKKVRIRTRSHTILDGIGMEASQDFKKWHILQPTGLLSVPASNFPQ